jgi:hypothetical protein
MIAPLNEIADLIRPGDLYLVEGDEPVAERLFVGVYRTRPTQSGVPACWQGSRRRARKLELDFSAFGPDPAAALDTAVKADTVDLAANAATLGTFLYIRAPWNPGCDRGVVLMARHHLVDLYNDETLRFIHIATPWTRRDPYLSSKHGVTWGRYEAQRHWSGAVKLDWTIGPFEGEE